MRKSIIYYVLFSFRIAVAQVNSYIWADMENISLPVLSDPNCSPNSYLSSPNNNMLNGNYTWISGNCEFRCIYNVVWERGFAVSNFIDTTGACSYFYDYCSFPLGGAPQPMSPGSVSSPNYLVVNSLFPAIVKFSEPCSLEAVHVSNAFYPTVIMRNGDALNNITKFGGLSGNEPDWFKIVFKKYLGGVLYADSIEHYLAEYNFTTPGLRYIQEGWQVVDISALGIADSLQMFARASNSMGDYYSTNKFCIDNLLTYNEPLTVKDIAAHYLNIKVFPNPATNQINANLSFKPTAIKIYDIAGELALSGISFPISVSELEIGLYFVQIHSESGIITKKITVIK